MHVRCATREDLERFAGLWQEFLDEAFRQGSDILPSERNLEVFRNIFVLYQDCPDLGVCVLGEHAGTPIAVGLWGVVSDQPLLETRYGSTANGWGIYVQPAFRRQGFSKQIRLECVYQLRRRGFRAVVGAAALANKASYDSSESFGFVPTHTQGVLNLDLFADLYVGSMEQGLQE